MSKKPYVAPELVTLGDVIEITQANFEINSVPDANFDGPPFGFEFTDNIAGN
ncbi:MAG: hypothetical protein AB7V43_07430 [Acidimicrobiia bacterium]